MVERIGKRVSIRGYMWFLPYERLILETQLSKAEVMDQINQATDITEGSFKFMFSKDHKPYRGKIYPDGFQVSRWIHYRNSFLPIIKGDIKPIINGSFIQITMHPNIFVVIFMILFMSFPLVSLGSTIFPSLPSILSGNLSQVVSFPSLLFLIGFPLYGYGLTMIGFKIESIKSKKFLIELFKAVKIREYSLFSSGINDA